MLAKARPSPLGTVSARMAHRVVEFCRVRGHDAEAMCRRAGVTQHSLAEPDARVPYDTAVRLGEHALELTRDENFGLHLAQDVRDTHSFDAGMLLLMASPTVRVALERMAAHQRYWGDGERATLRRVKKGLAVRFRFGGATGDYARHSDECAMAEIVLGVRTLSGQAIAPRVVRFRHAAPRAHGEHRELFACPLEFGGAHTEVELDDAALDATMKHANEAFCAIFERQVERALARLPVETSPSASVRCAARAALAAGCCTIEGTARALGMSTRTMQRRLQADGTSFAEILEALRREMAIAYLERGLAVPDVASLLGYSEATAFHHAFKRWTGASPSRYAARPAEPCEIAPKS
jgi:AraC-like DNA-binding protein